MRLICHQCNYCLKLYFQAFAIFCGMGINNTQMYESSVRTTAKHRVALDVLSYHVSAPPEDTQKLKVGQSFIPLYREYYESVF